MLFNRSIWFFSAFLTLLVTTTGQAENSWTLNKDQDDIQVWVRDNPGSAVKSFKGIRFIPAKLSTLVSILDDTQNFPRLLHQCKHAEELKRISNTESDKYIVTDMPWPVTDRDTIVHSVLKQNKKTRQVDIQLTSKPDLLPSKPGMVRIQSMSGHWQLKPQSNGTQVIYEMQVDPGGNIPKWLVNALAVDIPFYTLKNLSERAKDAPYKNISLEYILD